MTDIEMPEGRPMRAQIVGEVGKGLDEYWRQYHMAKDPRTIFTLAYKVITEAVRERVAKSDGFVDRHWLADLDDRFAQYYFNALDAFDHGDFDSVPMPWKTVFEAIGAGSSATTFPPKATILETLVLPLIVHVMHDLPLAVAEIAVAEAERAPKSPPSKEFPEEMPEEMPEEFPDDRPAEAFVIRATANHKGFRCRDTVSLSPEAVRAAQQHIHDYKRINDMLMTDQANVINLVQHVIQAYNPILLGWLDRGFGRYFDEYLTYRTMEALRGLAWYDATRLLEATTPTECEAIRKEIQERTLLYLTTILHPKRWWLRWGVSLIRIVSGAFRQWPEAAEVNARINSRH